MNRFMLRVRVLGAVCLFCSPTLGIHQPLVAQRALLLYVVDGLQPDAARTAMAAGAVHMKHLYENGVHAEEAYCTTPEGRVELPDGSTPWGSASPPNIAMHTGTHIFESRQLDDVFLAARRKGITSVFAGSAENYRVINTADFSLSVNLNDTLVVSFAVDKIRNRGARLISVHTQELRNSWSGPEAKSVPTSDYIRAVLRADSLLGTLIQALKEEHLWDSTFVVVTSDHGMGRTRRSDHPSSQRSSWETHLTFFGPRIRKGASIPYAESPDIAVFIADVLDIGPLKGHADSRASDSLRNPSGTHLFTLFEGNQPAVVHPKLIKRYLESHDWSPPESYSAYREAMIQFLSGSGN